MQRCNIYWAEPKNRRTIRYIYLIINVAFLYVFFWVFFGNIHFLLLKICVLDSNTQLYVFSLQELSMDGCDRLTKVPDFQFTKLRKLTLSSANFKEVPRSSFSRMSNLTEVRITDSKIEKVHPKAFEKNLNIQVSTFY